MCPSNYSIVDDAVYLVLIHSPDDDSLLDIPVGANMGQIRLQIQSIIITGRKRVTKYDEARFPDLKRKVHERSKKSGTHCVSLGERVHDSATRSVQVKPLTTVATFIFLYRPRDLLLANGIIPPDPVVAKREDLQQTEVIDVSDEDEEQQEQERSQQIQALETQLRALREQQSQKLPKVKAEPGINIKKEPTSALRTVGGVIDLT